MAQRNEDACNTWSWIKAVDSALLIWIHQSLCHELLLTLRNKWFYVPIVLIVFSRSDFDAQFFVWRVCLLCVGLQVNTMCMASSHQYSNSWTWKVKVAWAASSKSWWFDVQKHGQWFVWSVAPKRKIAIADFSYFLQKTTVHPSHRVSVPEHFQKVTELLYEGRVF